jgi:hypothetical protein
VWRVCDEDAGEAGKKTDMDGQTARKLETKYEGDTSARQVCEDDAGEAEQKTDVNGQTMRKVEKKNEGGTLAGTSFQLPVLDNVKPRK